MQSILVVFTLLFLNLTAFSQSIVESIPMVQHMDIDMQIRASEDPDFDKYLLNLQKQNQMEKAAAANYKKNKLIRKNQDEQARKNYIVERDKNRQQELQLEIKHEKELAQKEEELIKLQIVKRNNYIAKRNQERLVQLQKDKQLAQKIKEKLSRLPASIFEVKRDRVDKKLRKY